MALLAVALGLVVVLAVSTMVLWPRQVSCGNGSGSVSNQSYLLGSGWFANATTDSASFPASSHGTFSWSTPDGSEATFRVVGPSGAPVYTSTASSGSGSFVVADHAGSSEDYGFGIGLVPANETVDFAYGCTTYT
jgi:hypothetical protein